MKKEPENDLKISDDNNQNEIEVFVKQQKESESDSHLNKNKDNEIMVKEIVKPSESKEDEYPLIINSNEHNEDKKIEEINAENEKYRKNEDILKEEQEVNLK